MDLLESGEWIADLGAMTCRNYTWNITVSFEKQGEAIIRKMSDVPEGLTKKWGSSKSGFQILRMIQKEAEEVFLMVYYGNELEKCGITNHNLRYKKRSIPMKPEMGIELPISKIGG